MTIILDIMQSGIGFEEAALTLNRLALGSFFAISGYHKLFNSQRHASVVATLKECGVPAIGFTQWFVPCVEFFGGLSLLSGILAPLAALGLIAICLVATLTDGRKRIAAYHPIDRADYYDDVLYLPEVLYLFGLVLVIAFGPGSFTLLAINLDWFFAGASVNAIATWLSTLGGLVFLSALGLFD